ncbi:MAG: ScyD/ScyE family protein [Acidobacteria bacterium ACB1]|nr:hypothetical protein [Pyrinomonadaceae bacterium]MCE7962737.1 ScyD/ScyE family protein [Acidobacteria bacterium ACB1]RIJ96293.1 MAG: hypothetical protein DCC44_00845 [Acidobacteriota bacterium]
MRKVVTSIATGIFLTVYFSLVGVAQTTTVITTGLNRPTKVISGPRGSLLVSEAGAFSPNTGRVVVIDRNTGVMHPLITGLPSAVDNLSGPPDPDGTTAILLEGQSLYIVSGVGDAVTNIGGAQVPTGTDSSPIFNSVLQVFLPPHFESLHSEFHMTIDDQNDLARGRWVWIRNAEGRSIIVRLVVNMPDYKPEPTPTHPDAVRSAHLYGIDSFGWYLYVADASYNMVYRINKFTGHATVLAEMPTRPNPLFGTIGGPTVEAVPDNVRRLGRKLLIPELTGFPFVAGLADVKAVDMRTGEQSTIISGLASAMDVLPVEEPDCRTGYYALEFSANQLGGAPGRLRYFAADGSVSVIAPALATPTSMFRDERTGSFFVTNIFPGTITRIDP